jgi:hypothetical protein
MNERAHVKFIDLNHGGPFEIIFFFTVSISMSAVWLVTRKNLLSSTQSESMAGC